MPEEPARPSVSVALCTRNGERFVVEQLRSILAQSELPRQIVVSDDASTDSTLELVEQELADHLGARVDLVVLRNATPLGVTANFEQAVAACSGSLIALCDQDDRWLPDRIERMVDAFLADPGLSLLFSDAQLIDDSGEPLRDTLFQSIRFTASERREVHTGRGLATLLRRNVVTGATVMFRRELLTAALPFPPSWVHDEWLAIIAAITGRIEFLPVQLIEYRQHGGNQIGARKPSLRDKVSRVVEPRVQRNNRLAARAQALAERARSNGFAPEVERRIAAKAAHERRRQAYPGSRVLRVGPVLRAALSGRYRRYGRGRYDVVRDLLQPDR